MSFEASQWKPFSFFVYLKYMFCAKIIVNYLLISLKHSQKIPESPARGLRSSPPACMASLIVGRSKFRDFDLDLGLGQGHINIHSTCRTISMPIAQPCDCSTTQYTNTVIWMSWNIDIRRSLNCRDSFPRRKFKGKSKIGLRQAVDQVTYYDYQPSVLSSVRKWEEIDLEMCSCGQLSEGQMLCDLDLGSGQGHISMHNTCCTTSTLNHVNAARDRQTHTQTHMTNIHCVSLKKRGSQLISITLSNFNRFSKFFHC